MTISPESVQALKERLQEAIAAIKSAADLELLKKEWLAKDGVLRRNFQELRNLSEEEKPLVAANLNECKSLLEAFICKKEKFFLNQKISEKLDSEFFDLSLPGNSPGVGSLHPVTLVERRIASLLRPFGFINVFGPEVETEFYCFDALNIPAHHPAREMQDTFYLENGHVLRTHTTSVQARVLEKGELPVKIMSFGRVYRNETEDASHQAMFHQFELVWVEKGLSLSNLMAIVSHLLKDLFGKKRKVRFMPKFYPYTEPSIGPQVDCAICKGAGCSACGQAGWVTVGGAGMVHRKVLQGFKYDTSEVSGFAFGMGTSRLASQWYQIPSLRDLYSNDLRIRQAKGDL